MNKLFAIVIFLLIGVQVKAQKGSSCPEDLVPKYGQNRQWGYTNILGQWVINPIYTKVSPYIENKAVVMKGLLYGVIDCDGNVVLPPQYELLTNFRYGKIWAKQKGLWSLLTDKGKVLIPPQFQEVNPVANTEYTWVLKDKLWGLLNEQKGNFICKNQFQMAQIMSENATLVEVNDMYGVVNHVNCQFLIPAEISKVKKIAPRIIVFQQKGKWGLFNEIGIIRLNPEFDTLYLKFNNVLEGKKQGLSGLYDLTGKELLSPVFENIGEYSEGYFPVKKNGKFGYASRFGKVFIDPIYDEAYAFKNHAAIVKLGKNYGVIDIRNKYLLPAKYTFIGRNLHAGYFVVQDGNSANKKYYLLNQTMKRASENSFDTVFVSDTASLTRVVNNNKFSYYNVTLSKTAFNTTFDKALPFKYKVAQVMNGTKWGVINEIGKVIVPINYDSIRFDKWGERIMLKNYLNGKLGVSDMEGKIILGNEYSMVNFSQPNLLKVNKESRYGILKTNGEVVNSFGFQYLSNKFENPELPDWPAVASKGKTEWFLINDKGEQITKDKYLNYAYAGEGLYTFNSNKNVVLINSKGLKVGEESYDEIFPISDGKLAIRKGKKWGYINTKGVLVVPMDFEEVYNFKSKIAVVKKGGKYGIINSTGKFIVNAEYDMYKEKENLLLKGVEEYEIEKSGELKAVK